jgi:hypothetical protein
VWLPQRKRLVLGCEYAPELLIIDPTVNRPEDRFRLSYEGSFEELVEDPVSGEIIGFPLWYGHEVVAMSIKKRQWTRRKSIGDFIWGVAPIPGTRDVLIARFQEGQVWRMNLGTFEVSEYWRTGYGTRAIAVRPQMDYALASATYEGALFALPLGEKGTRKRLHTGALVRSLALHPSGETLYYGGRCGVYSLQLDRWLES